MNEKLEKQLKKALEKGTKNHSKANGKGSDHMRKPSSYYKTNTHNNN